MIRDVKTGLCSSDIKREHFPCILFLPDRVIGEFNDLHVLKRVVNEREVTHPF